MKLQTKATQVAQRTAALLRAPHRTVPAPALEPIWYRTVLANPPTHQLLPKLRQLESLLEQDRTAQEHKAGEAQQTSRGFYVTRNKQRFSTSGKHLYRVPKLRYESDRVRHLFYTNHPWELARPRNMVENGTPAAASLDWQRMHQPLLPLSGESVVQRTLWLADQPDYVATHGRDWFAAYEQARREFYRLRMREYAEQQVAREEAEMLGAAFGPSALATFEKAEQRYVKEFVVEATQQEIDARARRAKVVDDSPNPSTTSTTSAASSASQSTPSTPNTPNSA